MGSGPRHLHLPNPVLFAPDSRHPGVQDGSELATVQMPPLPLGLMVVQWADGFALGTGPFGTAVMLGKDIHLSSLDLQGYLAHGPGRL